MYPSYKCKSQLHPHVQNAVLARKSSSFNYERNDINKCSRRDSSIHTTHYNYQGQTKYSDPKFYEEWHRLRSSSGADVIQRHTRIVRRSKKSRRRRYKAARTGEESAGDSDLDEYWSAGEPIDSLKEIDAVDNTENLASSTSPSVSFHSTHSLLDEHDSSHGSKTQTPIVRSDEPLARNSEITYQPERRPKSGNNGFYTYVSTPDSSDEPLGEYSEVEYTPEEVHAGRRSGAEISTTRQHSQQTPRGSGRIEHPPERFDTSTNGKSINGFSVAAVHNSSQGIQSSRNHFGEIPSGQICNCKYIPGHVGCRPSPRFERRLSTGWRKSDDSRRKEQGDMHSVKRHEHMANKGTSKITPAPKHHETYKDRVEYDDCYNLPCHQNREVTSGDARFKAPSHQKKGTFEPREIQERYDAMCRQRKLRASQQYQTTTGDTCHVPSHQQKKKDVFAYRETACYDNRCYRKKFDPNYLQTTGDACYNIPCHKKEAEHYRETEDACHEKRRELQHLKGNRGDACYDLPCHQKNQECLICRDTQRAGYDFQNHDQARHVQHLKKIGGDECYNIPCHQKQEFDHYRQTEMACCHPLNREQHRPSMEPNMDIVCDMRPFTNKELYRQAAQKVRTDGLRDAPDFHVSHHEDNPIVLALGGFDHVNSNATQGGNAVFSYNPAKNEWSRFGELPEARSYHAASYCRGSVYVTGGCNPFRPNKCGEMVPTRSNFQLTIRTKRWCRRAEMFQCRVCHVMVTLDDFIYVIGGKDDLGNELANVEMYSPAADQWTIVKSLPEPLMCMGATSFEGCIWVLGGITCEQTQQMVDSVWCYDPVVKSWFRKPSLPEPRALFPAVTLRHEVWIWGGVAKRDGDVASVSSVDVYSPHTNKWEQRLVLGTAKHAAAIAKAGGRVYLLGGTSSGKTGALTETDIYDRDADTCYEGAPLPERLTGLAAAGIPVACWTRSNFAYGQPGMEPDNFALHQAASIIQTAYRDYRRRQSISGSCCDCRGYHAFSKSSSEMHIGFNEHGPRTGGGGEMAYREDHYPDERWRNLHRVCIRAWPPYPDPTDTDSNYRMHFPSDSPVEMTRDGRIRRYVPLNPQADPNLGMLTMLHDETYQKAKRALGLRRTDSVPSFAPTMCQAENIQELSVPMILTLGGMDPKDPLQYSIGCSVMRYHPLKDRFEWVGLMPEARNHHAATFMEDCVYVTGGYDPDVRCCGELVSSRAVFCLEVASMQWERRCDMICARAHHTLVAHFGMLYAIGGRNVHGRLMASVEKYSSQNDTWDLVRPMPTPRMGMAGVVYDDCIWVLGGIEAQGSDWNAPTTVTDTVIAYDPNVDQWLIRPPVRIPRAFLGAGVMQHELWICGGCEIVNNCLTSNASIDAYDTEAGRWENRGLLVYPRHAAATVALENCIYMFGGISSQEWGPLAHNELFMLDDGSAHLPSDLPIALTGMAAVAIPAISPSLRSPSLSCMIKRKVDS